MMAATGVLERCVAATARAAMQLASAAAGNRLSILIFHRVHAQRDPLFPGEIDALAFERLMRLLRRSFTVLPLSRAVEHVRQGTLPARAASITFDDGYADNHDLAWPILRSLGLPATVFVSTGFLDGGRMWNDTVIECLRRCDRTTLDVEELGVVRRPLQTLEHRRELIDELLPRVKYMSLSDREQALRRLHRGCGAPRLPDSLMMTSEQVRALSAGGVEIGSHTVNHPILAAIDDAEAEAEIAENRAALERLTGRAVSLFAYPNGRPGRDYADRHVDIVRRLGFSAAVSTAPNVSRVGADIFQLGRFTPWDQAAALWLMRLAAHHVRH